MTSPTLCSTHRRRRQPDELLQVLLMMTVALLALAPAPALTQRFQAGTCPQYQTTDAFTVERIAKLVGDPGFVTVMALVGQQETSHSCQRLQFFQGSSYVYSYNDGTGNIVQVWGRYKAQPSRAREPGTLELNGMRQNALGADVFGNVRLYPVMVGDMDVYIACTSFGLFHSENVYVLMPYGAPRTRSVNEVRAMLKAAGIPQAESLLLTDQSCDPDRSVNEVPEITAANVTIPEEVIGDVPALIIPQPSNNPAVTRPSGLQSLLQNRPGIFPPGGLAGLIPSTPGNNRPGFFANFLSQRPAGYPPIATRPSVLSSILNYRPGGKRALLSDSPPEAETASNPQSESIGASPNIVKSPSNLASDSDDSISFTPPDYDASNSTQAQSGSNVGTPPDYDIPRDSQIDSTTVPSDTTDFTTDSNITEDSTTTIPDSRDSSADAPDSSNDYPSFDSSTSPKETTVSPVDSSDSE